MEGSVVAEEDMLAPGPGRAGTASGVVSAAAQSAEGKPAEERSGAPALRPAGLSS